MSACCSNVVNLIWRTSQEEAEQKAKSRQIDKFLEKDKHIFKRQVHIYRKSTKHTRPTFILLLYYFYKSCVMYDSFMYLFIRVFLIFFFCMSTLTLYLHLNWILL